MKIGKREFDLENHTYVMGILNMTPDSFSDGGSYPDLDDALRQTEKMLKEGADIIDVGGESTRPGHVQISCREEIERIAPMIEKIRKEFDPVISVDTYKSQVAEAAVSAGADMLNDIWGFRYDKEMVRVASKYQLPCCLMHNRHEAVYHHLMEDVLDDLRQSISIAVHGGVKKEQLILDPGIGFGKTYEMNLEVMRELHRIRELGYPVLLGISRKSVIGLALNAPVDQRLEGTLATTVYGVMKGCSFVRVHDVLENKRVIKMTEAILYGA